MGGSDNQPASNAQLLQAMASFGGGSGAADGLNAVPLGADMSQQTFLTTPQHSARVSDRESPRSGARPGAMLMATVA
jgi:hypothetical protein